MLKSETRPRDLVKQMSGGQRQAAGSTTQLSSPELVLMDEPTAAIWFGRSAKSRIDHVFITMLGFQSGHRMPDIFTVCDRVVVLRRGEKVADKHILDTSQDEVTGLITGAVERTRKGSTMTDTVTKLLIHKHIQFGNSFIVHNHFG